MEGGRNEHEYNALSTTNHGTVGRVITSAAEDTPYEVGVKQCLVGELDIIRKEGLPDKDYLYYQDDMPTLIVLDENEIVLEAVCAQAQAVLTELKADHKHSFNSDTNVNSVNTSEYSAYTKPRKTK